MTTKRRDQSIFYYKVLAAENSSEEIARKINEELNRGINFVVSQDDERPVFLTGEWKGWADVTINEDRLQITINNNFFSGGILEKIITSLWVKLFDFGKLRLEEFQLSESVHSTLLKRKSQHSLRQLMQKKGPYLGLIYKPVYDLSLSTKLEIAEKFARMGGCFIKEDETYFVGKETILEEAEAIQRKMTENSDQCYYVPNVTNHLFDDNFLQELFNTGIRAVMINYLVVGFLGVYHALKGNQKLLFWGHRVGFRSLEKHISMKATALLASYCGLNMLHVGTPFLSNEKAVKETIHLVKAVKKVDPTFIPIFSKISLPIRSRLLELFGEDIIFMVSGAVRTKGQYDWEKIKEFT